VRTPFPESSAQLRFVSDYIRRAVTESGLNLATAPKSRIELVIQDALLDALAKWPIIEAARARREALLSEV